MSNSHSTTFLLTVALLVLLLLAAATTTVTAEYCSECKPGYYCEPNPEQPARSSCYLCGRGFYCPGDAHYHVCEEGTASEDYGTVACKKCDQGRTGINRTYCLLPDAPQAIHTEQLDGKISKLVLNKASTSVEYFTSSIETGYNMPVQLALVMFRNVDAEEARETNLEIYASTKTGAPSKTNFEQHVSGVPTITVPFVYSKETEFFPWYFTLAATGKSNKKQQLSLLAPLQRKKKTSVAKKDTGIAIVSTDDFTAAQETIVQAGISYHSNNMRTLKLNAKDQHEPIEYEFFIDREHGVDYWTYLFFTIESANGNFIEQGTVLNITSITYNDSCTQTLLYSEHAPLNPFPHAFTRDVVGDIEESKKTTQLNYVTRPRPVSGNAYFAVSPSCVPYKTTPKLKLILQAVKH